MMSSSQVVLRSYFLLLVLIASVIAQYPNPTPFTGVAARNPSNKLHYQDINIVRRVSDGTYFRFSKSNDTGLGLSVATAPAFRGPWTYSYEILHRPLKDAIAANRNAVHLWAPEVHFVNSTYYLYYGINLPNHGHGQFDIAVATSPDLSHGSWIDHGSVNIPSATHPDTPDREYVRLGVNLLANSSDPSGIDSDYKYLTFGSFNHGLYGVSLADDLLTIAPGTGATEILADQYNPGTNKKIRGNKTEGSYQLHNGDYIYYFYSIGSCCASPHSAGPESVYRVEVCDFRIYLDNSDPPSHTSSTSLTPYRTILRPRRYQLSHRSSQSYRHHHPIQPRWTWKEI
jgi:arabinan endo-1,5-alpha-L-arabinosidase